MAKPRRHIHSIGWGQTLARLMASSADCKTQGDLARKSGVAQTTIGRILREEVDPQTNTIAFLAEAFGMSLKTLAGVVEKESDALLGRERTHESGPLADGDGVMSTDANGSDALTLDALVWNIGKATRDFTVLSREARMHLGNIAKGYSALGEIRERLIRLREPVRGWERQLWVGMWRDDVDRAAYRDAEAMARMLDTRIGDLRDLFEFRHKEITR